MANIQDYVEGLVFTSPAFHYEIANIPLDCRNSFQVTREDVLYYYNRIISLGQLDIRYSRKCIQIDPSDEYVDVTVAFQREEEHYRAEQVVFTAWYSNAVTWLPPQPVK